ncbi:host-nuclease inhibitor Gam family protein [Desulfofundulus thermosubterraneus]|uniref:Mu-like prophage host-nuclease inhibitor protein Gam n=1 Tax=Desulfofundulus thermosubterraneus DSM 16057 TaxID=1121432 RepID=A0A1M6KLB4_9FIRM|nr:host-nuclease inhibitor Gam family protein [Desulfofundulus thermosubterraneus]SHJ59725.1 Mu-like prophage host-nuclease inhibitor protein Gam [Desulfofundulus thermosubterraneus DSM 16057]
MRKRMEEEKIRSLKDWVEVDDALKEIGRLTLEIEGLEARYNEKMMAMKEELAGLARPLMERREYLELLVKDFAERHREDMDGRKSKVLNFGRLGFRQSTKVILRNVKAILAALKAKGMTDCIIVKEEVSKDELKKYDPTVIESVGARLKVEDVFWYEVNRDKLAEVS